MWQENFQFHELKQIVRQQDKQFADLLNRVRIAKITDEDVSILKSRATSLDNPNHFTDALHVYGTNQQAHDYNLLMLAKLNTTEYSIPCTDVRQDRDTRQITLNLENKKRSDTGGLETNLVVKENAVVRLTCNIDVTDGLANGARGIIHKIITKQNNNKAVDAILIKFENETVGEKAKATSQYKDTYPDMVPIYRHGAFFQYRDKVNIFRSQFPLILAWASTIHSVQGLTVDRIVVDLSKIFAAGQAYVALSRVKTLEGLQILNFKKTAIRKDKLVDQEMERLRTKAITYITPQFPMLSTDEWFKLCHLNARGYLNHLNDIKADNNICSSSVICFTETHLRSSDNITDITKPIPCHIAFRSDRARGTAKGGIIIFAHPSCNPTPLTVGNINGLEFLGINAQIAPNYSIIIITLYRQAKVLSIQKFLTLLQKLLNDPALHNKEAIILGDFNEDIYNNSNGKIDSFLSQYGFQQLLDRPTTNQGSLLDHVYYNGSNVTITDVNDTYYSDHDCTSVAIMK